MPTANGTPAPKDEVRELLDQLPDDSWLDDIQYHIFVRQKIRSGLAATEEGRVIPQAEVEKRTSRWLDK